MRLEPSEGICWKTDLDEHGMNALRLKRACFGAASYGSAVVDVVVRVMEQRCAQPEISSASIVKEVHLSRRHLGRMFQRCTGKTFREYLADLRVLRSLPLLVDGRHPIKAVAAL